MNLTAPQPDVAPPRGRFVAAVAANVPLCREHNRVVLRVENFPPSRAGQFVQVKCRDADAAPAGQVEEKVFEWTPGRGLPRLGHADLAAPTPVLRRPFSLAGRRDFEGYCELDIISRDVGPGTRWLSKLREGDAVDILGPLGNGFDLPAPGGIALLVGGGVGIPPMIYLAQRLAQLDAEDGGRLPAVAFCGAMTLDLLALTITDDAPRPPAGTSAESRQPLYNLAEFAAHGVPCVVSTDDGSYAYHGRVTDALDAYLDSFFADSWDVGSRRPTIYTCGPEAMMKAVADLARRRGLACQVAVERAMACGMGTCQSCVIRQRDESERGWSYRLACTQGPVFEASTLLW